MLSSIKNRISYFKKRPVALILFLITWSAAITTILAIAFIIAYILAKGLPHITPSLFEFKYTSENASLTPALITTLYITLFSLLLAVPLGIFSAIYLVEYSKQKSPLVKLIRTTTEVLAGIPSIVFGLFGYLIFVIFLKLGYSVISGSLTLAIIILPVIIRSTEEALLSVPISYREAGFGLGAGKLRTVFKVIIPSALPGIFSGIMLSSGRILGETAALIYTLGTASGIPKSFLKGGRTLAVHMYALLNEGLYYNQAYATAVILLLLVLIINSISAFLVHLKTKKLKG